MYSLSMDLPGGAAPTARDALSGELAEVMKLREAVLASRELLYCSPAIRLLIEDEIPRLVTRLARQKGAG